MRDYSKLKNGINLVLEPINWAIGVHSQEGSRKSFSLLQNLSYLSSSAFYDTFVGFVSGKWVCKIAYEVLKVSVGLV